MQLNDTHPAIAVAELMRLLVDEHAMEWDEAWAITRRTFAYTNHTLLPEALEHWPLALFASVLPRHLEIIYEINARFLDEVRIRFLGDERTRRAACRSSTRAASATCAWRTWPASAATPSTAWRRCTPSCCKTDVLQDFHELWPEKFHNKTNGVTPRRWLALANPRPRRADQRGASATAGCATSSGCASSSRFADDRAFRARWRQIKHANKEALRRPMRASAPASRSIRTRCSTCRSSASTSTSAST